MVSAWIIMLVAGNFGHALNNPDLFLSYWFCLPVGILIDIVFYRSHR